MLHAKAFVYQVQRDQKSSITDLARKLFEFSVDFYLLVPADQIDMEKPNIMGASLHVHVG